MVNKLFQPNLNLYNQIYLNLCNQIYLNLYNQFVKTTNRRFCDVAVKQIKRELMNEKSLSEFWGECEIISKFKPHANIVQFFGVSLNPLCLVTEFLPNGNSTNTKTKDTFYIYFYFTFLEFISLFIV